MFNLYGTERLIEWKKFRDSLETSKTPFEDLIQFWSLAPFVNPYLDPSLPESWPDPWRLVLDSKLDNLAITLGMYYTLKLTQRFIDEQFEIHSSMFPQEEQFFLLVGNQYLLDCFTRTITMINEENTSSTRKIWSPSGIL